MDPHDSIGNDAEKLQLGFFINTVEESGSLD